MNPREKITMHLPCQYGHGMCDKMHEFLGKRPIYQPPHIRDLMGNLDSVYKRTKGFTLKDPITLNGYIKEYMSMPLPVSCKNTTSIVHSQFRTNQFQIKKGQCQPHKSQNWIQELHFQSTRNEYKIMVDQLGAHVSKGSIPQLTKIW